MIESLQNTEPHTVEFQPKLGDKIAELLGRVGVKSAAAVADTEPGSRHSAGEFLDQYMETTGNLAEVDAADESARPLIQALQYGPRLKEPLFLNTSGAGSKEGNPAVSITIAPGNTVELPVSNFVYANGLRDWVNGRGDLKDGRLSRKVIRSYARKRLAAPPIGMVMAEIQPNGLILFSSIQDGGHRVAAAHLRQDESIRVSEEILVRRINSNYIDLPAQ